jgi:hypothetical protein
VPDLIRCDPNVDAQAAKKMQRDVSNGDAASKYHLND